MRRIHSLQTTSLKGGAARVFIAVTLAAVGLVASGLTGQARDKRPDYGRLEITTSPESYPIYLDGTPHGTTAGAPRMLDLPPGRHTVEIQFPNGARWIRDFEIVRGKRQCIVLNYASRPVIITKSPCPYTLDLAGPNQVNDGDLVTFTSDVSYNGPGPLSYTWTISPVNARVVSGAGTNTITVDTTGLGHQRVTAALLVDDGSGLPVCRQVGRTATNVIAPPPPPVQIRKFDEFPSVAFDDDKARLDNLAIELQNDPTATGYLFVYGGRNSRKGQADRLAARAMDYLTNVRGIDQRRLVVTNGGYRETDYFEFWLVPQGATPPVPSPTVSPNDVRPAQGGQRSRRRR